MTPPGRLTAALLAAIFAAAYATYSLVRHWSFGTNGFDLGIFDQAIWHMSRLERPASTIGGYPNLFGDHFHPIILLLVPIYALFPRPETLLVAQAVLLGASIVPVFIYARLRVGSDGAAAAFAASYGLFWGMQKAAGYDFHEIAFAPLCLAVALLAMETGRLRLFWAAAIALCLVKEDLILVLAAFALRLAVLGHARHAAVAAAVSVAGFAAVMQVVLPWFKGNDTYAYQGAYEGLTVFNAPLHLVSPPQKLVTMLMWVLPFALLPLRSPLVLLVLPLAVIRLLSSNPNYWGTAFHYGAPLAPLLAAAAADGYARLSPRLADPRIRRPLLACMLVLSATLPGRLPVWRIFAPGHYARMQEARTGYEAIAMIPADASVTAQGVISPHLTRRNAIYLLGNPAPPTDYVVATERLSAWPLEDFAPAEEILDRHRRDGYRVVFARDGWIVLRRPDDRDGR